MVCVFRVGAWHAIDDFLSMFALCAVSKNMYFCVSSEVGGRTLLRLLVGDAGRETEELLLHETVPSWVTDVVVSVSASHLSFFIVFTGGLWCWLTKALMY